MNLFSFDDKKNLWLGHFYCWNELIAKKTTTENNLYSQNDVITHFKSKNTNKIIIAFVNVEQKKKNNSRSTHILQPLVRTTTKIRFDVKSILKFNFSIDFNEKVQRIFFNDQIINLCTEISNACHSMPFTSSLWLCTLSI